MLSDLRIRTLKALDGDRWISDGNKLYLRVRKAGARSWVLRRRKEEGGNLTLGQWPDMSLAQARIKAGGFTGKVLRDLTLRELLEEWHADMVRKRYRRPDEVAAYFARMEPALLSTKLSDLERLNIRHSLRRYAEQRGPVGANRLLSILKTALRFARDAGYMETDLAPFSGRVRLGGPLFARRALGETPATLGFPVTPVRPIPLHALSRLAASATISYLRVRDALDGA